MTAAILFIENILAACIRMAAPLTIAADQIGRASCRERV